MINYISLKLKERKYRLLILMPQTIIWSISLLILAFSKPTNSISTTGIINIISAICIITAYTILLYADIRNSPYNKPN